MLDVDLPYGYRVHFANTYTDRWKLYKLLIILRESEFQGIAIKYIILWLFLFLVLLVIGFVGYLGYLSLIKEEPSILSLTIIILLPILMTISGTVLGIFLSFALIFFIHMMWIRDSSKVAIATYRSKVIGGVQLNIYKGYVTLAGLYVAPSYRKKGLGSHLVTYILSQNNLPVYLTAIPGSESFYIRLGFVKHQQKRGYNMIYIPTLEKTKT